MSTASRGHTLEGLDTFAAPRDPWDQYIDYSACKAVIISTFSLLPTLRGRGSTPHKACDAYEIN